jgi:hypothetical protein
MDDATRAAILRGERFRSKDFIEAYATVRRAEGGKDFIDPKHLSLVGLPQSETSYGSRALRKFDESRGAAPFRMLTSSNVRGRVHVTATRDDGVLERIEFDVDALKDAAIVGK